MSKMFGIIGRMQMNNKRKIIIICTAAVLIAALAIGGWLIFGKKGEAPDENVPPEEEYYVFLDNGEIPDDNAFNSDAANYGQSIELGERIIATFMSFPTNNPAEDRIHFSLVSTDKDGADMQLVTLDQAGYLATDGEWIYFVNYTDGGKFYKVKPDGTGKAKISDETGTALIVDGDRIYYLSSDDSSIRSIGVDGSDCKIIVDSTASSNFSISGERIYFFKTIDGQRYLVSTTKDGENLEKYFVSVGGHCLVTNKGYAYFSDDEGNISRSKLGSKTFEKISDTVVAGFFYIYEDKIYFLNGSTSEAVVTASMNLDGSEEKKLSDGSFTRTLSIAHGKMVLMNIGYNKDRSLFFYDAGSGLRLNRYKNIDDVLYSQEIMSEITGENLVQ